MLCSKTKHCIRPKNDKKVNTQLFLLAVGLEKKNQKGRTSQARGSNFLNQYYSLRLQKNWEFTLFAFSSSENFSPQ